MATQEVSNKALILKNLIEEGVLQESDMEIRLGSIKLEMPEGSNGILVKNLFLSCDPFMLGRMLKIEGHYHGYQNTPGLPIDGFGVSRVVESAQPEFKKGDLVWGITNWEEYSHITNGLMFKIPEINVPLSYFTGILGMPGMTAYAGFYEVCSPKEGEYVYVSAAYGAIGQLVGQFAKLLGCYVVGSAGSDDKVDLLKNKFGFDEAFNYNEEPDLVAALRRCFPEGIDIFFESIGGRMIDAVLPNMRYHGRIAICGLISECITRKREGVFNLGYVILKHIRMEGFMVNEYFQLYPEYLKMIVPHIGDGKIVCIDDIVQGLESGPGALAGLFSGFDAGQQVVQLATGDTSGEEI